MAKPSNHAEVDALSTKLPRAVADAVRRVIATAEERSHLE